MNEVPATLLCDFYKISHREQYPEKTEFVYSTWIPRASRIPTIDKVVAFGFRGFIETYLIDYFNENFFDRPVNDVVDEYVRVIKYTLGIENPDYSHIVKLHNIGYLPIRIDAVPEGTLVPLRIPMLTIENTHEDFFWLTNYLETLLSCSLWQGSTSATIAFLYRQILENYAKETNGDTSFVQFQGHDFSMRGMGSFENAKISGAGHLLSFVGTDTIPAICYLEKHYDANIENELVGVSVPATEHSVMCTHGQDELEAYRYIIEDVYPTGLVSIVSDTWDLWSVMENVIPELKEKIMSRDGKVVIRPDSGIPEDIICGSVEVVDFTDNETFEDCMEETMDLFHDYINFSSPQKEKGNDVEQIYFKFDNKTYLAEMPINWGYANKLYYINDLGTISYKEVQLTSEQKGVIEVLWDIFGGNITEKGYRQLDSHIGCIYGDAITIDRCNEICERLRLKGFASTNMVFGIGSFTYQYNTRDTFGFALKSTHVVVDGKEKKIFKNPVTDKDKIKKSQTGMMVVLENDNKITLIDNLTLIESVKYEESNLLKPIFFNGTILTDVSLDSIRKKLLNNL